MPITNVILEYSKFDIQKIKDPNVYGTDYQNGRMKNFTNIQEYVLERDNHTCQLCKKWKNRKLNSHHIIWKSEGGSDIPENQITVCEECHKKIHMSPKVNDKILKISKGIGKKYVPTTLINIIIPHFYNWLLSNLNEIEVTYGYETKYKRRRFNLDKSHWIDAYLISIGNKNPYINGEEDFFIYKQFRRHNRSNISRNEDRKYYFNKNKIAINRNKRIGQSFDSLKDINSKYIDKLTVKPAIKPWRKFKGFEAGDVVKFDDNKNKTYIVKGFMNNYLGLMGEQKYNFPMKKCKILKRNEGLCCIQ